MGGSGIRRPLKKNEKAVVIFEIYGELKEEDRKKFNTELSRVIKARGGEVTTSDVMVKAPGDP